MTQKTKQPKTKEEIIEQIKPVLRKHDITKAGIYGSYARGNTSPDSDVDLLIDFNDRKNIFDLVGIEQELENKLNLAVDLSTFRSLSDRFKPYITSDLFIFYNNND
ncbi:MAG: nucleotidyltransferase family protein [Candidatus Paceibacteria bacterium]